MTARSRLQKRLQRHGRIGLLVKPPSVPDPDTPVVRPAAPVQPVPAGLHAPERARPAVPPAAQPPAEAPPTAAPPHVKRTGEPESAADDSGTWKRLKTIYNRHEQEAADPDGTREQVEQAPDIRVKPRPDSTGPVRRQPESAPPETAVRPDRSRTETDPQPATPAQPHPAIPDSEQDTLVSKRPGAERAEQAPDQARHSGKPAAAGGQVQRMFPSTQSMGPHLPGPAPGPIPTPYGGASPHTPTPAGPTLKAPGAGPSLKSPGAGPGLKGPAAGGGLGGGFGGGMFDFPEPGGGYPGDAADGGGAMTSGGNITVGGNAEAGGGVSAGGALDVGGSLTAGGSVTAGTSISAGGNIEAGGPIQSGTDMSPGGDLRGSDVSVTGQANPGGNIQAEGDMSLSGQATAGAAINSSGDLSAAANVDAGSSVMSLGKTEVSGNATSGAVMSSMGELDISGNATSGSAMMSLGDIDIGGSAQVGGAVVSGGDTTFQGAGSVGALVKAAGDVNFDGSGMVGGTVIAKGKTTVGGVLSAPNFKGSDVEVSGSLGAMTIKADTLSAGGSVTVSGRATVGTVNAGKVVINGSTNLSSGSVSTKQDDSTAGPVPLQDAWPVQRAALDGADAVPPAADTKSSVEIIPPRGPRPAAQRKPGPPAGPPAREKAVQTEIGALPADLWTLLGRDAPADAPAAPPRQHFEHRAPAPPEPPDGDPAPIQRQAAEQAEADTAGGGGEDDEIDVDQLAGKVYAQLRRRLQREAERNRHGK